ncbi:HNH endonuclease signature motif containing protein [Spirulina major CS-329]|jgi:hypothetical protein|uniref:HNH endonuclease signature motif containing protein n=1 Tax=Spirulina TaxID=1154 RepID=UPI00232E218E|nr:MULTISPECIES: HNH endonuclease signature motif containing protein [Spirulina]MDB9496425.1 HNH endonuclease signature motif containing protein [Spirulina subsalsa CS-330]MDB9504364.1 HNH endonuclease signature motif containing protein [Spirulina major CS-329]
MSKEQRYKTEIQFIKDNYLSMSAREISTELGLGIDVVKRLARSFVYDINESLGVEGLPGFKIIKDSPIHAVNNKGTVVRIRTHKQIRPSVNKKGYFQVCLQGKKSHRVHRLVAENFVPNPGNNPQVNHIDGNKLNNSSDNLEWVTDEGNRSHAIRNGLWKNIPQKISQRQLGEGNSRSKLKESDVLDIYNRLKAGEGVCQIAKHYGVNHANICAIKSGKSWKALHDLHFKVQRPERDCS